MKLMLNNISQTNLSEVIDNPIDAKPSRIKEKPESLLTTIANCINIPLARVIKPVVEQKETEVQSSETGYKIIANKLESAVLTSKAKMINVKEKMLENIKKMSKVENEVKPVIVEEKAAVIEEKPIIEKKNSFINQPTVEEYKQTPINETPQNNNIISTRDFDFEKMIREQETKAAGVIESRKAATESERKLQEVVVEQTESEKRYQEELARKEDLMRKLQAIINNRSNIFEKETSTNENKVRENNEQIDRVQKIIESNNKKTDLLKEQNDKIQSLYEAASMRLQATGTERADENVYRRVA